MWHLAAALCRSLKPGFGFGVVLDRRVMLPTPDNKTCFYSEKIFDYAFARNRISLKLKVRTIDCAPLEFYTTFFPTGHQAIRASSLRHSRLDLVRQAGRLCSRRQRSGGFPAPTGLDVIQRGKGHAGKHQAGTGRAGGNAEGQHKPD
jgi:hypothetical protein